MNSLLEATTARIVCSNIGKGTIRALHTIKHWGLGRPHTMTAYLKIDDPHSHLLVQAIPDLIKRYDIEIQLKPVCYLPSEYYPDVSHWTRNANSHCELLSRMYNVKAVPEFMFFNSVEMDFYLSSLISLASYHETDWVKVSYLFEQYRAGKRCRRRVSTTRYEREKAQREWRDKGHFLTGLIEYDGEIYHGLDRLDHLEERLINLRLSRALPWIRYNQSYSWLKTSRVSQNKEPVTLFFSFGCPYSYIAFKLASRFCESRQVPLILKPVPLMALQDRNISGQKKRYVVQDAAREAFKYEFRFIPRPNLKERDIQPLHNVWGYLYDEKEQQLFVEAAFHTLYVEGTDVTKTAGLKRVLRRSRMDKRAALWPAPLNSPDVWLETNLKELKATPFQEVPVVEHSGIAFFGHDQLGFVDQLIR